MLHRLAVHVIAAFAKFRKVCVAVRCGVLQCVAVCCDAALQRAVVRAFAVFASLDRVVLQCDALHCSACRRPHNSLLEGSYRQTFLSDKTSDLTKVNSLLNLLWKLFLELIFDDFHMYIHTCIHTHIHQHPL